MALTKNAFPNRNTFFGHRKQRISIPTLIAPAFFPTVRRTSVPWPPVFVVALTIQRALASDCDVPLFEGINKRRVVEHLDAFPTRENNGQVVFWILAELDRCAF